jgi:hypothetical protein
MPVETHDPTKTLPRARAILARGDAWWVDGVLAEQPDYAAALDTLRAEGYPVTWEGSHGWRAAPKGDR